MVCFWCAPVEGTKGQLLQRIGTDETFAAGLAPVGAIFLVGGLGVFVMTPDGPWLLGTPNSSRASSWRLTLEPVSA